MKDSNNFLGFASKKGEPEIGVFKSILNPPCGSINSRVGYMKDPQVNTLRSVEYVSDSQYGDLIVAKVEGTLHITFCYLSTNSGMDVGIIKNLDRRWYHENYTSAYAVQTISGLAENVVTFSAQNTANTPQAMTASIRVTPGDTLFLALSPLDYNSNYTFLRLEFTPL